MADGLAAQLRDELGRMLAPLAAAATPDGVTRLLAALGRPDGNDAISAELQRLAALVSGITALDESALASWDGLTRLLGLSQELLAALRGIEAAVSDPSLAAQLEGLGLELTELITGQYLRADHPRLHRAAAVLTLVDPAELTPPEPTVIANDGTVIRLPWQPDQLHFGRLPGLVNDPFGTLKAVYFPNNLAAAADAHESAARLFPLLHALARILGLSSSDGPFNPVAPAPPDSPASDADSIDDPDPATLPPPADDLPDPDPVDLTAFQLAYFPRFVLALPALPASGGTASPVQLSLAVLLSSAAHAGGVRGLLLTPEGDLSWTQTRGSWQLSMTADAQVPAFVIGPGGLAVAPADGPVTGATAALTIGLVPAAGAPAFRLGSATGTRLELGTVAIGVGADIGTSQQSVEVSAATTKATLVLTAGDGDGFLSAVLPGEIRADFDFGIVLSSATGLHLKSGVGLTTNFPTSITIGPARLESITLAVSTSDGLALEATAAVSVQIGPFTAVIDGAGLRLALSFPDGGGNLGPVDLAPGFAPPTGVGLAVDAGVVTGGGFLEHTGDEYAGALDLLISGVAVKAYGLIQTKLPSGQPGYSFIAVISAEFLPPIELPFGFSLDGVGGLIGINRSISQSAIESALWAHHLDGLLFPKDPVASAPQLLSALDTYFPATPGRYIIGPLVKIGWSANLVVGELAVLFELPEPLKILLIGDIQVNAPTAKPVLVLHISFDGGIDFGAKTAFFDASLHDSKIAGYPISGDLAFRYGWGDDAVFALALGGFHPQFQPPASFPTLKRLAISISSSVAKLDTQAYLALTSNTLQFGARVELTAGTGGFNVHGWLGFDALFEKDPLSFEFDLTAGVELRSGSSVLASVHLDGKLSGPTPWHISGDASLSLLFFDVSVHFDKTWGSAAGPAALPDPLAALTAALADRSGWSGLPAPGVRAAISPVGTTARCRGRRAARSRGHAAHRAARRAPRPADHPVRRCLPGPHGHVLGGLAHRVRSPAASLDTTTAASLSTTTRSSPGPVPRPDRCREAVAAVVQPVRRRRRAGRRRGRPR